jgi:hypothetical protein
MMVIMTLIVMLLMLVVFVRVLLWFVGGSKHAYPIFIEQQSADSSEGVPTLIRVMQHNIAIRLQ